MIFCAIGRTQKCVATTQTDNSKILKQYSGHCNMFIIQKPEVENLIPKRKKGSIIMNRMV